MNQFPPKHRPPKFSVQAVPVPGENKASLWKDLAQLAKSATNTVANVAGGASQAAGWGLEQLMPEVLIPVYILPCGSDANGFRCVLDCDDIALRLNAGILARPKLVVWAGRTDMNRTYLGQTLRREFGEQLEAARMRLAQVQLTPAQQTELSQQRDELASKSQSHITAAAMSGGAIFLLTTGPWVTLFLGVLAVSSGGQGLNDALEVLSLNKEIRQGKQGNVEAQRKLEQKLAAGGQKFIRAVSTMKIQIHPMLQRVAATFCRADGVSSNFPPASREPAPDLRLFLEQRDYQQQLSFRYLQALQRLLAQP